MPNDTATHYPWYARARYRFVRASKDAWAIFDRRVKISRVTEHVYVGGRLTPQRIAYLRDEGVRAMVSLQEEALDPTDDLDAHLWLPSHDGRPPREEQLRLGAEFVATQVALGRKVYVHCHAGVGRAPTLAAVYLVSTGMPPEDALRLIKEKRPWIRMNRGQVGAVYASAE
ncbi:MAG: dual specificity protein phosphatase [Candidatus Poribacteria bacterium]|nr:dual specificity protein phosphatase [Candidatus Poribacteria bacterium]